MSRRKTERLLNLVICLLATRRPLSAEQIRHAVPGYDAGNDEAFQRMFERDKTELREIGIPVQVHKDPWEDEPGYRIERQAYELPEITLEADEAAVLGLAAQVWQRATLAEAASGALLKLRAGGVQTDESAAGPLELRVDTRDPAFAGLWEAVRDRRVVRFDYRAAGSEVMLTRTVEPWGVVSRRGRWYLVGHDRERRAPRVFRLSRISGPVTPVGRPGAVTVPDDVDIRSMVGHRDSLLPERAATVRVRVGTCLWLRQTGTVRPGDDGWDVVTLDFADPEWIAGSIVGFASDAEVLDPPDVREAVIRKLKGALA
ncbi:WYL domain-containing protein [Sphaerisporangium album]|uniref:WYL domain-containing protein n=1 Tax=Sphaerisporangium album TaxID=509200 RepID=A0A367FIY5_9ACTN|nr:WYL domain-containing protein [Sphaerisporangium album]RCG29782.1 WYL domain-containing protein [Sphaerisporangium album]